MTSYNPDIANAPLPPDTVLQDRYLIVRQLGKGGMGAVYEATDQRLGKTVALKETLSSEPSMRKQFEREARLLAGMQHSALPQVTDHFVEGNRAFLVMQFIEGVDLARIISQQPGPFPRDQVIAWADQLLDALIYLHTRDRQVIHRDIKPHNLKLTANGQIALLDFGLAKAQVSDPSVTASQAFFGYTKHYAPLEQIQDQRTDPRSDIYALGATLYHLLTGTKPPDAMVRATAVLNAGTDPLQPADKVHAAVGSHLAAILNKAMAQKPEERYASASEFREALRRVGRTSEISEGIDSSVARGSGNQPIAPTVHISELTSVRVSESPSPQIALVGSARRFGPAGATAVLAILATLAFGLVYGSPRWLAGAANTKSVGATLEAASTLRQTTSIRSAERSRATDNPAAVVKAKSLAETKNASRTLQKGTDAGSGNIQFAKKPEIVRSQSVSERNETGSPARKSVKRVGAPSIRLPNPDLGDQSPSPSPDSRVRTFGSTSAIPTSAAPKFYRAADGTQIVKFSDGSVQYVRPGQIRAEVRP